MFSCCKTNCSLETMITDGLSWDELMLLLSAPSENNSQAPDVTAVAHPSRGPRVDLPSNAAVRGMSRGQSRSSMMETADGNDRKQFFFVMHLCGSLWLKPLTISSRLKNKCHRSKIKLIRPLLLSLLLDLSPPCHMFIWLADSKR